MLLGRGGVYLHARKQETEFQIAEIQGDGIDIFPGQVVASFAQDMREKLAV
jgi:hypothetical protein